MPLERDPNLLETVAHRLELDGDHRANTNQSKAQDRLEELLHGAPSPRPKRLRITTCFHSKAENTSFL